ncbi:MAG: hypothetical protein C6I01_00115 [Epsilonproteobacteria bacterium]|jgi:outer membrane lipoprotein-sorting protein|nr:hypothetical protein [Campylobacterota bacterium]NPA88753.1 hypothetical protein [Campylobacterota bacterium]
MAKILGRLGTLLVGVSLGVWGLELPSNFSAHFNQVIYGDNGKKLTYTGEVYFRNNQVYWHYSYPTEKMIWVNQGRFVVYEPDLMQVTIAKPKKNINFLKLIKTARKIAPHRYTTKVEGREYNFTYTGTLQKVQYRDKIGNLVVITFSHQSTQPQSDALFKPHFPPDVDIIYR